MLRRRDFLVRTGSLAFPAVLTRQALALPNVGTEAPEIELTDSNGKRTSLRAFRGAPVVLEWSSPQCPYVRKHYVGGHMQTQQRKAREAGVTWMIINSMAPGKNGYVDGLEANAWLDEQKAAPAHYLLDPDGNAAAAYEVKVALSMFVVDAAGKLFYSGAIDDKPSANPRDIAGAKNYVQAALAALRAGERMVPASTRPYGCLAR